MRSRVAFVGVFVLVSVAPANAQTHRPGKKVFETFCARCHGADGKGGDMGPPIALRLANLDDTATGDAHPQRPRQQGHAAQPMPPATRRRLVAHLRELQREAELVPVMRLTAAIPAAARSTGVVVNEGFADVQLRTDDNRVHLLRRRRRAVQRP